MNKVCITLSNEKMVLTKNEDLDELRILHVHDLFIWTNFAPLNFGPSSNIFKFKFQSIQTKSNEKNDLNIE